MIDKERVEQQARDIEAVLRAAGCPAMPLPEGVQWLAERRIALRRAVARLLNALPVDMDVRFPGMAPVLLNAKEALATDLLPPSSEPDPPHLDPTIRDAYLQGWRQGQDDAAGKV
jgi:hypothetical protein